MICSVILSLSIFPYFLSLILLNLGAGKEPEQMKEHLFFLHLTVRSMRIVHNESLLNESLVNVYLCNLQCVLCGI